MREVDFTEMEDGNRKWKQKKSSLLATVHGLHIPGRLLHAEQRGTEFLSFIPLFTGLDSPKLL